MIELIDAHFLPRAVEIGNNGPFLLAVLYARYDSGYRNDTDRKNSLADKAVDKGALPRLELTEDGDIDQLVVGNETLACLERAMQ